MNSVKVYNKQKSIVQHAYIDSYRIHNSHDLERVVEYWKNHNKTCEIGQEVRIETN